MPSERRGSCSELEIGPNLPIHHQTWGMWSGPFNMLSYILLLHTLSSCLPLLSTNQLPGAQEPIGSKDVCWRCWGAGEEGTVSKSYAVRQGCIKIHTELKHPPEYWSVHRSCPAAPLGKHFYPHLRLPYIHISLKAAALSLPVKAAEKKKSYKCESGRKQSSRSSYTRLLCLWCAAEAMIGRQRVREYLFLPVCGGRCGHVTICCCYFFLQHIVCAFCKSLINAWLREKTLRASLKIDVWSSSSMFMS